MSSAEKLYILSHNVGKDMASPAALSMLIQQSNADIVLLQELPQTYIDEHLPAFTHIYPYQSYSPHQSLKQICMAILCRHPIVRKDHFKLAVHGLVHQQRAVIDIYGNSTIVYNIHLTYPRIELAQLSRIPHLPRLIYNDRIRHEEVNKLITLIQSETFPVIASGDFNLTTHSEDYRHLIAVLKDAYTIVGSGPGRSWPARPIPAMPSLPTIPFVRIDYLFHSSSIHPCTSQFQKKTGSDHLPLLTSIQLTNSAAYISRN